MSKFEFGVVKTHVIFPWAEHPFRLISWWEMEQFSASAIYVIAKRFEQLREVCNFYERAGKVTFTDETMNLDKVESIELRHARSAMPMSEDWQKAFSDFLEVIETQSARIGLTLAVQAVREYKELLGRGKLTSYSDAEQATHTLDKIIGLSLRENLFMFIPLERAPYFGNPLLFGEEVNKQFITCQYDIVEAGNCYAAGRSTAVVFHLMRIMETGVQQFGTKLGITLTGEKNWQLILNEVNKAIKNLPIKDPSITELSEVSANLYAIKLAWRNEVMHPNDTYTLEEADNLIRQVKIFMQNLAKVL